MMKKVLNIICILTFTLATFIPAIPKVEATTLKEFKDKVASLEDKKEQNDRVTADIERQIANKWAQIENANQTIEANKGKVESSKELVAESQESIKIKTEEMQDVIKILQYTGTEQESSNVYLEYIFESESISDLMERQYVIEQIVNHTQNEIDDLHQLVTDNKKLQEELAANNIALENSIVAYEEQTVKLQQEVNELVSVGLDFDQEIKMQRSLLNTYIKAGCKDNDDLDDCYYNKLESSGSFSRPISNGVVTNPWRSGSHYGIDLGGVPPGTKIYAPASGTIIFVADKASCGGNIIYMHAKVNGVIYTLEMAHLRSYNVRDGQIVKKGDYIATVGGDSSTKWYDKCTFGTHLHYGISKGKWFTKNGYGADFYKFQVNTNVMTKQALSGLKNQYGWKWSTRG